MQMIIEYARAEGLKTIEGQVLGENTAMLAMCKELGFDIAPDPHDPDICLVRLVLAIYLETEDRRQRITPSYRRSAMQLPSAALSTKTGAVIAGKAVDLGGRQSCGNGSHPRIDVVALAGGVEPQLLRQVVTPLFGQDRRFDGPADPGRWQAAHSPDCPLRLG